MFNPLNLVNKPVRLKIDAITTPISKLNPRGAPACGVTSAPDFDMVPKPYEQYEIVLYTLVCEEKYDKSYLRGIVPPETLIFAVLCHEIAHIVAQSFTCLPKVEEKTIQNDGILAYINNVLEDARAERIFMKKFGRYAEYIQLMLSTFKWAIGDDDLNGSAIQKDCTALFFLIRFGCILDGSDPDLIDLAFPLVNSSEKGDRANCAQVVTTLYTYLVMKHKDDPDFHKAQNSQPVQQPMTDGDIEEALENAQVFSNGNKEQLAQLMGAKAGNVPLEHVAGSSGPPPSEEERDDDFYDATVAGNASIIIDLRAALLSEKYKLQRQSAYEGEMTLRQQNQLYRDSLTGEESRSYHVFRRNVPDIQIVLFWDTSDSTQPEKDRYAAAIVCILAALDGEPGTETALIEFNSYASEVMSMGGDVKKARIHPHHRGGTALADALELAFGGINCTGYDWKAHERYLVIVGDGDIYDWFDGPEARIEELRASMGIIPMMFRIVSADELKNGANLGYMRNVEYAEMCMLEELPDRVLACITGQYCAR